MCRQIKDHLTRKQAFTVWYDDDIPGGAEWWSRIEGRIARCDGLICLVSERWSKSTYCQKELDLAQVYGKRILPLPIEPVEIPSELENIHFTDATGRDSEHLLSGQTISELLHAVYNIDFARRAKLSVRPGGLEWCEIPEGAVSIRFSGGDQKRYPVSRFLISKFPVTNSQYRTFLSNGYRFRYWWHYSDDAYQWRLNKKRILAAAGDDERPCTHVNWYEAVAFTRWLSAEIGATITLPTETQWQRAARVTTNGRIPGESNSTLCSVIPWRTASACRHLSPASSAAPARSESWTWPETCGNGA